MKNVLLLFALVLLPLTTWAQSIATSFSTKSNGVMRFALVGKGFCESDSFSVRVLDKNSGTANYYTSASGNQNWAIGKQSCGFNQEFNHNLLKPGVVLQVETFAGRQQMRAMWLAVPCYNSIQEIQVRTYNFSLTEITTGISCAGGAYKKETGSAVIVNSPDVVVVPAAPAANNCSVSSAVANNFVTINAICDRSEVASVLVSSNNEILCRDRSVILGNYSTGKQTICTIPRNSGASMPLRIEVATESFSRTFTDVISKNPTFSFQPQARMITPVNQFVGKSLKALSRGNYWQAKISAQVFDRDSDNNDVVIRTQLIEVTSQGDRVIGEQNTSSGGTVTFNLEHQYITPLMFGQDRHEGPLKVGQNTLKLRVYDAYSQSRFVDMAPVTLNLEQ